jgi:hypothetical protein
MQRRYIRVGPGTPLNVGDPLPHFILLAVDDLYVFPYSRFTVVEGQPKIQKQKTQKKPENFALKIRCKKI